MGLEALTIRVVKGDAVSMAKHADIRLTPNQISSYAMRRIGIFDQEASAFTEQAVLSKSDHRVLETLLTPEQKPKFRSRYPSIFNHNS